MLFTKTFYDLASWGKIFQSIDVFQALIEHIYQKHGCEVSHIRLLTPGTNAVFRIGNTVCKIFAPLESGENTIANFHTETFGLEYAKKCLIPTTDLLYSGYVDDNYRFYYMILRYVNGISFIDFETKANFQEKVTFARQLKAILTRLNKPIEQFNSINVYERALKSPKWITMDPQFQQERLTYLAHNQKQEWVYVHGDINPDNIMIDEKGNIVLFDFADAVLAPVDYELALIVCGLFDLDGDYLKGFIGEDGVDEIVEKVFHGLLIHDYGTDIIRASFTDVEKITSLEILKTVINDAIKKCLG